MKIIRKIIPFIVVGAIFTFLFENILRQWHSITSISWNLNPGNLALFIIFLLPIYAIDALSWHLITRALGARIDYLSNFKLWTFSNAGRFLPGSIWQYAGRVYLAHQKGMSKPKATTAVVLEALFVLLLGSVIILATLTFWQLPISIIQNRRMFTLITAVGATLLLLLVILLSNKLIAGYLIGLVKKLTKKDGAIEETKIPISQLPLIAGSFFLQFLFGGLVLFFLSRSVVDLSSSLIPVFIGIYAASWLLGYITLVAPSGLGVQEVTLATLLSSYMPFPVAVVIAILLRISFLSSETLALVFNLLRKAQLGIIDK